ncbi:MAG: GNAT family N-acetyltransferase [Thermoflexales bacterium]|nr:GNAT family N-acetyltransferase [Thermoflexales bacterium]
MEESTQIRIRRARPADAERIAAFVNRGRPHKPVTPSGVLQRFGTVGFLLAEVEGEVVGLLGWQVENLVVRVTDFLIFPARLNLSVGRALLTAMEEAAQELMCEAAILIIPANAPPEVLQFWETFGYQPRDIASLPRAWREAAREANPLQDQVVLKQLRTDRVLRPI